MERESINHPQASSKYIECDACAYEWGTKSQAKYVSCPHCKASVKNPYYTKG